MKIVIISNQMKKERKISIIKIMKAMSLLRKAVVASGTMTIPTLILIGLTSTLKVALSLRSITLV